MKLSIFEVFKVTEKITHHDNFVTKTIIIENTEGTKSEIVLFTNGGFSNLMSDSLKQEFVDA